MKEIRIFTNNSEFTLKDNGQEIFVSLDNCVPVPIPYSELETIIREIIEGANCGIN